MQVQAVGLGNEALIRVAQQVPTKELSEEKVQAAANDKVKGALGENIEVRRIEVVGPTVSSELKRTGVIAVVASMFGILLYVWFRFEWQFAVAAILALSHDVFITVGMFSLLWYEFDLSVVAAHPHAGGLFDQRYGGGVRPHPREPAPLQAHAADRAAEPVDQRDAVAHVLTSVTTALAVLALYIFGTQVIHGFSFAMLFGIVIGTYSSIFVAAPLPAAVSASSASGPARPPRAGQGGRVRARPRRENVASK